MEKNIGILFASHRLLKHEFFDTLGHVEKEKAALRLRRAAWVVVICTKLLLL
jgi:hypothetical protein